MSTMVKDPRLLVERRGIAGLLDFALRRVRQGEIGALPVILGLVVVGIIFQTQNSNFLTAVNLTNLFSQIVPVGVISIGVVFVLLLGEVDLSLGSVSGFCAAIVAVLAYKHGVGEVVAVLTGAVVGVAIGLFQGFWIVKLRVPSFIVGLAGLLAWQGALLYTLGSTGTINISDTGFVGQLENRLLPVWLGWVLAAVFIVVYGGGGVLRALRRRSAGLQPDPPVLVASRVLVLAAGVLVPVAIMSGDRSRGVIPIQGIPLGVVLFIGLVVVFDYMARRTRWGRHVFASGGNVEAARRAGIHVDTVRISVFAIAGLMAALGGIMAASRLFAVNQSSGGQSVLLYAIAAPVIGGTSLFGGRGTVWSAVLGGMVIGSIDNGMDLLALSSSVKFMITGGVLLLAVTIDAVARRGRQAAGRA